MKKLTLRPNVLVPALAVVLVAGTGTAAYFAYTKGKQDAAPAPLTGRPAALQQYHDKNYAKAADLLQQQIKQTPKDPSTYNVLANVERDSGQIDTAIANYKKALELNSAYLPAYLNLANVYINANQKAEASAILADGLKAFPDNKSLLDLQSQISAN